jgi:hypothetical protein
VFPRSLSRHCVGALAWAGCAALPLLAAASASEAWAKTIRVTIAVPMPSRIDMEGLHKVLVTRFRVEKETPEIDLNHETVAVLRRELRKKTNLEILDVEPPPLPEEPFADLLANTGFWRKLAEGHGADLVLSGEVGFQISDRSGYVQQDQISPVTGQRVRRTVFVNREGFDINLHLFFIRGSTGKILYEDRFTGENTVSGGSNDRLAAFYTLFEQIEDDVLGIVGPARKTAQRSLFTE